MTLLEAIDSFLELKRSLGFSYSAEERILRSFGRATGDIGLNAIRPDAVRAFCRASGPPTRWQERKHYALRVFFKHLSARGLIDTSPLTDPPPRIPRSFRPRIYSPQELARLLKATAILESGVGRLRQETYRTLLRVLYGAGLRPGEGLRLRCCDVDLDSRCSGSGTRSSSSPGWCRSEPPSTRRSRPIFVPAEPCPCCPGSVRSSSPHPEAEAFLSPHWRRRGSGSASTPAFATRHWPAGSHACMTCATLSPSTGSWLGTAKAPTCKPGCPGCRPIWAMPTSPARRPTLP